VTDAYEELSDLADHSASLEACLFALHATMARAISPVGRSVRPSGLVGWSAD
jgi:hypothetical protein